MIYPKETKEFQPFQVELNGAVVTTGVKVAVIRPATRPVALDWADPVVLTTGGLAVLIDQLELGVWNVWAQVTAGDEVVVVHCGDFKII
jgi:hypothetical protein